MRRLGLAVGLVLAGVSSTALAALEPGDYLVVEIGAEIAEHKANGKAWDSLGGDPDPDVELRLNGRKVGSCEMQGDTRNLRCQPNTRVSIDASAVIDLVVDDVDLGEDDLVGNCRARKLLDVTLGEHITCEVDGQLVSAYLVLAAAPEPETFAVRNRARLIGLGVGAALALLIALVGRSYLFPAVIASPGYPENDPGIKVRCRHCSALNDEHATHCQHCEAAL